MTQSEIQGKLQKWLNDFYEIKEMELPEGLPKYLASRISDVMHVQDDPNVVNFNWGGELIKAKVTGHSGPLVQLDQVDDAVGMLISCDALVVAGVSEAKLAKILDVLDGNVDGVELTLE
jgi:hypothetical protein